jgi:hypothetical protein
MRHQRRTARDDEYTDEELKVFGEFADAVRDGKNPDVEKYLARVPGTAQRMRQVFEGMLMFAVEVKRLRKEHPDVDVDELLLHPRLRRRRKQ